MTTMTRLGLAPIGLLLLLVAFAAPPAAARTLESVGAVGVRDGDRRDPKQRAVAAALREAVHRVAEELLVDAVLADEDEEAPEGPDLAAVLGNDMVAYTTRYKILEDRGIGPAMFVEEAGVSTEYVVVAEVQIEVDKVRERLVREGLLDAEASPLAVGNVLLEVEGLRVYPALEDLRAYLVESLGVRSATPVRLERGRTVLAVGTPLDAEDLVARLERSAPPHLAIVPLAARGAEARIGVRWTPASGDAPANGGLPPVETGFPEWARPD